MIKNIKLAKQFDCNKQFKNLINSKNYSLLFKSQTTSFSNLFIKNSVSFSKPYMKSFYSRQKKFFSNNPKEIDDSQEKFTTEDKNNLLNNLDEEFEKLLEKSGDTELEKRIKILSIKLLQANFSKDIMNLYDEKYLKSLIEISADEIILFLYFYTSLLDKETTHNYTINPIKSIKNLLNKLKNF